MSLLHSPRVLLISTFSFPSILPPILSSLYGLLLVIMIYVINSVRSFLGSQVFTDDDVVSRVVCCTVAVYMLVVVESRN